MARARQAPARVLARSGAGMTARRIKRSASPGHALAPLQRSTVTCSEKAADGGVKIIESKEFGGLPTYIRVFAGDGIEQAQLFAGLMLLGLAIPR